MKKTSCRSGEHTTNRAINGWYLEFTNNSEREEGEKELNRKIAKGYKEANQRGRHMND